MKLNNDEREFFDRISAVMYLNDSYHNGSLRIIRKSINEYYDQLYVESVPDYIWRCAPVISKQAFPNINRYNSVYFYISEIFWYNEDDKKNN